MIDANKLSIGILLPIESYEGAIPKMENQVQLIQRAEALGYDTVWVRDIPLNNPDFKEVGQMFDPWIYLAHIASLTLCTLLKPLQVLMFCSLTVLFWG